MLAAEWLKFVVEWLKFVAEWPTFVAEWPVHGIARALWQSLAVIESDSVLLEVVTEEAGGLHDHWRPESPHHYRRYHHLQHPYV